MKLLHTLCIAALFAFTAGNALADTIGLESYGSTASAPAGANNTSTNFLGYVLPGVINTPIFGGPSYNVGTGGVWAAPTGTSNWVSNSPNAYPGGSVAPPSGVYVYSTTFFDMNPLQSTGTLTLLADDTASVFLNGTLIEAPAASTAAVHCDVGTPNCITPTTFDLTGFVQGTNTLTFGVYQEHGAAEGLDFSGSVNSTAVTPEPGTLFLFLTGLVAGGALLYLRQLQLQ